MDELQTIGAYLIVSYSKEPKYIDFNCVCLEEEEAKRAIKRINMENGSTAVAAIHKLAFFEHCKCSRHRPHDHKIDDGHLLVYVLSEVVGDELAPIALYGTYESAEQKAVVMDMEHQIDLVKILES